MDAHGSDTQCVQRTSAAHGMRRFMRVWMTVVMMIMVMTMMVVMNAALTAVVGRTELRG